VKLSRVVLLLLCGLASLTPPNAHAEPARAGEPALGRLFLTPEWRALLERQRQLNVQPAHTLEGERMRLDGVVVRSSGKSTVWINGQPQPENSRSTGVTTSLSRRHPGHVVLSTGNAAPVDLKVGVTLDQANGEKHGGLAGGEIRIQRRAASR